MSTEVDNLQNPGDGGDDSSSGKPLLAALRVAESILRAQGRDELLRLVCETAVTLGQAELAWVALTGPGERWLLPVASHGPAASFLDTIGTVPDAGSAAAAHPPFPQVAAALQDGQPYLCDDLQRDPCFLPWQEAARACGLRAYAAFPLILDGGWGGVLHVHGTWPGGFENHDRMLLDSLANSTSLALERLANDIGRRLDQALEDSRRSNRLLDALGKAQARFIVETDPRTTFDDLLAILLDLTDSEYGFIGEVLQTDDGQPYLKTHAITNIAWNEETRTYYAKYASVGLEFFNTKTLFGVVMTTGETVIANDPARDPRRAGIPPGHPPLRAFLGMPFLHAGEMLGMVGIANRAGGYEESMVRYLEPFLNTCASLVAAYRNERRRQEAEDGLRELNSKLARVNQELEAFTYSVSHDLKAPLRAVNGYTALLQEDYAGVLDEKGRYFLARMVKATDQMNLLIDDLLAYSRLERRPFSIIPVDVRTMVDSLLAERDQEMAARGVDVHVEIPWTSMAADYEGLAIALRNLLENALKFTRDAQPPRIEIGGRETDTAWILWMRDNGCGFDMRYYDKLFEIFQRLHRVDEYPGTGVGLALVRKAMQRMNGRAWAESEPGAGARFYLEIPRPA